MVTDHPNLISHSPFLKHSIQLHLLCHLSLLFLSVNIRESSSWHNPPCVFYQITFRLQEPADNNLLCDLLLCQIAPSTPLTLWELISLLSVLLWASIVHYLHSSLCMYLNVLYSSTRMNTFFACLGFLYAHWNQFCFFFFTKFWIRTLCFLSMNSSFVFWIWHLHSVYN